ncbi:MAG TPA: NYN domain-containing protein [Candidatus Dormibacteraeota bacterium]|nr:NYN domain-containing protein [Candidatus Dormibacteraeota bacterium]
MGSLIVDGYNVIHAWPSLLRRLRDAGLEDARRQLVHLLSEYAAQTGEAVTVVFDSHGRSGGVQSEVIDGVTVQYGSSRASADHVIERSAYEASRGGRAEGVMVVTSDRLQRALVSAMGVATMSAAALETEVARGQTAQTDARDRLRQAASRSRRLEEGISEETRRRLEQLRRGRPDTTDDDSA